MINVRYQVKRRTGGEWAVVKIWTPNYADSNYTGDSTEREQDIFWGTLPECSAYIILLEKGMI